MKTIFKSKTAALALVTSLAGVAANFFPEANEVIANNIPTVLIGLGLINLALRKITHGKVNLFPTK